MSEVVPNGVGRKGGSYASGASVRSFLVGLSVVAWLGLGITGEAAGAFVSRGPCGAVQCHAEEARSGAVSHPWHFDRRLGARTIQIDVSFGACARQPSPAISPRVVERPGRAVITAFVRLPPQPPATKCLRLRLERRLRVRLGSPVAALVLYDGSFSPPRIRYAGKVHVPGGERVFAVELHGRGRRAVPSRDLEPAPDSAAGLSVSGPTCSRAGTSGACSQQFRRSPRRGQSGRLARDVGEQLGVLDPEPCLRQR